MDSQAFQAFQGRALAATQALADSQARKAIRGFQALVATQALTDSMELMD